MDALREELRRERELRRQAEERDQQARHQLLQEQERTRLTTFDEYIRACHEYSSLPLRAAHPSQSTKGSIPAPNGRLCPTELRNWTDLHEEQASIYSRVRSYLQSENEAVARRFPSLEALKEAGRTLCRTPISSEKRLEFIEESGKNTRVHDIIDALCQVPAARRDFSLGVSVRFDSHSNALEPDTTTHGGQSSSELSISTRRKQPDSFCIYREDEEKTRLLLTAEYKPPHKLSVETLCAGLRPMKLWEEVVNSETIPTEEGERLRHNATKLACAAVVQEYHVMIQTGLAYSFLSTGIALVLLYVPHDQPTTLYYRLCVPNRDVDMQDNDSILRPTTAVARILCLCLMSCRTPVRSNAWRVAVEEQSHRWETDFEYTRSQIPDAELRKTPPGSEYVPSSPASSPLPEVPPPRIRSKRCRPPLLSQHGEDEMDPSDSEEYTSAQGHKRTHSDVDPSSSLPSSPPSQERGSRGGQRQRSTLPFCTQACLSSLQRAKPLDESCPNVVEHRKGQATNRHQITLVGLVEHLKQQLDRDVDHFCDPFGTCGAYGAPFRVRCESYGYTVVGKGTTSHLWGEVYQEASVYKTLHAAQGSAVPVFVGSIDLKLTYRLHGAGAIKHMLLMAWGGKHLTREQTKSKTILRAITRSRHDIEALGIEHCDIRPENLLWSEELQRVLFIDFHRVKLIDQRIGSLKRTSETTRDHVVKRKRLMKSQTPSVEPTPLSRHNTRDTSDTKPALDASDKQGTVM